MRRHAKAATAGSNHHPRSGSRALRALLSVCALVLFLALSAQASASPQFEFKEVFGGASAPTFAKPAGLAVDQSDGDLLVIDQEAGTISRFKPDGTPDDFSALGTNVIDETPEGPLVFAPANEQQIAVDSSGTATDGDIYVTSAAANVIYIFARSGEYLGKLSEAGSGHPFSEACGVAVDSSGAVYVGTYFGSGVKKFSPATTPPVENSDFATTFSQPSEPCILTAGVGPTTGYLFSANYNGFLFKQNATTGDIDFEVFHGATTAETVAPDSGNVLVAHGPEVTEFDASGPSSALALTSLSVGGEVQGVAVGPSGETYVSRVGSLELEVWTHFPLQNAAAGAATGVTETEATLHGSINTEGLALSACKFEYGPVSSAAFQNEVPCSPSAASIPADSAIHDVSAALTGLQASTTYKFRLKTVSSSGTVSSEVVRFTTNGPPQITDLRASFADQSSATLEAKINPSGFGTSYRFEWGPTASYGNSVPAEFEPFVGSGTEPIRVVAKISGLSAATTYHFRVVASNSVDTAESPDATLETLNSCGLPEGRCYELVSPRDAGPVALPGVRPGSVELSFQAATEPGGLAYVVETGFPDATKGAEVLYHGTRGADGWSTTQLSPPILVRNETAGSSSSSGKVLGLSPDLSCGVVASNQPLTDDPSTRLVVEAGGGNLYRRSPDGSYTTITKLTPEDPTAGGASSNVGQLYELYGLSPDCSHVLFSAPYRYPGVPAIRGLGEALLYEWDEGTLSGVGFVPAPGGSEAPVGATPGGLNSNGVVFSSNALSEDGSRAFFSAKRQTSPNPAEIGKTGVFVRENGTTTRDLSLSETSTPDEEAIYQYATRDGSRVFFMANAGLTDESSSEGTDLYEYDLEEEELTDLSVDHEEGGAQVAGFIGASEDGSHVYFVARGQLVPGEGGSFAENVSDQTYSVYCEENGETSYVGSIKTGYLRPNSSGGGFSKEDQLESVIVHGGGPGFQTSRVSPSGRYLLFESSADITGYDSGNGVREAYLYDAEAGSQPTVCISCRQDGKKSGAFPRNSPLEMSANGNPLRVVQTLTEYEGKPRVFFSSFDRLATGGAEGRANVYEWAHGQVFQIATEPPGLQDKGEEENGILQKNAQFIDASADGTDLYFRTPQTLNGEDGDGRYSIYDARIGGGFPEPPAPPAPCEPKSEGSCQGGAPPVGAPTPTPSSSTFNGPGNVKSKAQHKKRHKRHHRKRKARHAKHKRHANANRRAGK